MFQVRRIVQSTFRGFVSVPRRLGSSGATIRPPPELATLITPLENAEARGWIAEFRSFEIPKNEVELSFARSSGPGGQVVPSVEL